MEQKIEEKDEAKNKLELSVELEKTKTSSLDEDVGRLNQTIADLSVSFFIYIYNTIFNSLLVIEFTTTLLLYYSLSLIIVKFIDDEITLGCSIF